MAAWQKFNSLTEALCEKVHNFGSDTLKIALSNTAPTASNTVLADITQIAATGTYAPATVTVSSSSQTGGTYSLVVGATTFTPSGASYAPFRYAVLYNDTATNDELIAFYDYGASYTLAAGEPFTFKAGTALTLA